MNRSIGFLGLAAVTGCGDVVVDPVDPTPFEVVYGTPNSDAGLGLLQTAGGDLVVAGAGNGVIAPTDGTLPTPSLTRIAPDGTILWTRIYAEMEYGAAEAVVEDDQGFLMLADRHDDHFRVREVSLREVSSDGSLGPSLFDWPGHSVSHNATQPLTTTADGDLLVLSAIRPVDGPTAGMMTRLTPSGTRRWMVSLGDFTQPSAVTATSSGRIVVVSCRVVNHPAHDEQILVSVFDPDGTIRWSRLLGESDAVERPAAIVETPDGGFTIGGIRHFVDPVSSAPFLMWIDGDGNVIADLTITEMGSNRTSRLSGMIRLAGGGYALSGWTRPPGQSLNAFLVLTDAEGAVVRSTLWGGDGEIHGNNDLIQLFNGHIAMTGFRGPDILSFGGTDTDAVVRVVPQ